VRGKSVSEVRGKEDEKGLKGTSVSVRGERKEEKKRWRTTHENNDHIALFQLNREQIRIRGSVRDVGRVSSSFRDLGELTRAAATRTKTDQRSASRDASMPPFSSPPSSSQVEKRTHLK